MIKRVVVKHLFQGEVDNDYPEIGVFYKDQGVVIVCDPYGAISVHKATQVPGEDTVIVEQFAEQLSDDNPEFVVSLILSGGGTMK